MNKSKLFKIKRKSFSFINNPTNGVLYFLFKILYNLNPQQLLEIIHISLFFKKILSRKSLKNNLDKIELKDIDTPNKEINTTHYYKKNNKTSIDTNIL